MINKFMKLNFNEKLAIVYAGSLLFFSTVLIKILPPRSVLNLIKNTLNYDDNVAYPKSTVPLLYAQMLLKIKRNISIEPSCLAICMAYYFCLISHGTRPRIHIGCAKVGENIIFHSWVIVTQDIILGEREDLYKFKIVSEKRAIHEQYYY